MNDTIDRCPERYYVNDATSVANVHRIAFARAVRRARRTGVRQRLRILHNQVGQALWLIQER